MSGFRFRSGAPVLRLGEMSFHEKDLVIPGLHLPVQPGCQQALENIPEKRSGPVAHTTQVIPPELDAGALELGEIQGDVALHLFVARSCHKIEQGFGVVMGQKLVELKVIAPETVKAVQDFRLVFALGDHPPVFAVQHSQAAGQE